MLALTSTARIATAPDISTAVESGVAGLVVRSFIGLMAPAHTPRSIVDQIARASRNVLADVELQQLFLRSGLEPVIDSTPEAARRFIEQEIARWTPVIRSIGLHLD